MFEPSTFAAGVDVTYVDKETVNIALTGGIAAAVVYGRQIAELVHKLIPDSKGGWLGTVRNVAGIIAGYRKNNDK